MNFGGNVSICAALGHVIGLIQHGWLGSPAISSSSWIDRWIPGSLLILTAVLLALEAVHNVVVRFTEAEECYGKRRLALDVVPQLAGAAICLAGLLFRESAIMMTFLVIGLATRRVGARSIPSGRETSDGSRRS